MGNRTPQEAEALKSAAERENSELRRILAASEVMLGAALRALAQQLGADALRDALEKAATVSGPPPTGPQGDVLRAVAGEHLRAVLDRVNSDAPIAGRRLQDIAEYASQLYVLTLGTPLGEPTGKGSRG